MGIADKIDIGIITAPRDLPTLDYSVRSLRRFLPDCYLNVFSEPGKIEVDAVKMNILVNNERLGALANYNRALNWILKFGKKPYIWITEDDYVYNSTILDRLNEAVNFDKDFGYFNLFTNYWNPSLPNPMPDGWSDLQFGYYQGWGMNYLMKRENAIKLSKHEAWNKYLETTNKNIDAAVTEVFRQMGLPMFYHNPSPSCSCAVVSTLGHECKTDGLHFKLNI